MDWKTCVEKREAKQIKPDVEMAESLQKTSANKVFSSNALEFRDETVAAKISLSYDAVRELLEAIALMRGFKIYNHICYVALLKEILEQPRMGEDFDTFRKIRNDINYYGKEVSIQEAQQILKQIESLRKELIRILE